MDAVCCIDIPFLPTERPVASTLLKESFRIVIFIVPIVLLIRSAPTSKLVVLRLIPPIYRDISIRVVVSAAWVCLTIGARWQSNKNRFLIPHQSRFGLSGSRSPQSLKNLHSDRISYKSCKDMVLGLPFLIFSTIRLHPFSRLVFANTANHCCVDFYIYPYICPWRSPRDTFFLGQRRSVPVYFSMYSMIIANAT